MHLVAPSKSFLQHVAFFSTVRNYPFCIPNEQVKSARKSLLEVAGLNIVFGPPMITTWECISLKSNFVTRLPVLHFGR